MKMTNLSNNIFRLVKQWIQKAIQKQFIAITIFINKQRHMVKQILTQTSIHTLPKIKNLKKPTQKSQNGQNRAMKLAQDQIYEEASIMMVQQPSKKSANKRCVSKGGDAQDKTLMETTIHNSQGRSIMMDESLLSRNQLSRPILFSQFHAEVQEVDFRIYLDRVIRQRITSIMLINGHGQILFSDKAAHQHFEGSLNNFNTMRIQQLFLTILRAQFLDQLKNVQCFNEKSVFNWVIYSKNLKRRYSKVPFIRLTQPSSHQQAAKQPQSSLHDVFFRFLKSLLVRIRPIKLITKDRHSIKGFWNQGLLQNQTVLECFMLQIKPCTTIPDISVDYLLQDPVITKYIQANNKKAEKQLAKSQMQAVSRATSIAESSIAQEQKREEQRREVQNAPPKEMNQGVFLCESIFLDDEY